MIQFELSTYGRDYYARHQSIPTEEDSPHFKRLITRWNLANKLLQSWGIKLWCDPSITKRNEPKCIVHVWTYLVLVIGCVDIKHLVLVGVVLTLNILCLWSGVWHKCTVVSCLTRITTVLFKTSRSCHTGIVKWNRSSYALSTVGKCWSRINNVMWLSWTRFPATRRAVHNAGARTWKSDPGTSQQSFAFMEVMMMMWGWRMRFLAMPGIHWMNLMMKVHKTIQTYF